MSSWNKIYRHYNISNINEEKTQEEYWEEDHTRLDYPLEIISYAKENFGAFYDKKRKGWYIKGNIPYELRQMIEKYKKSKKLT